MTVTDVGGDLVTTTAQARSEADAALAAQADPITTEVVRGGLNSAADEMKITLRRTAYSPIIYEMVDFACALFDRRLRLLAQADALPIFLGTMGFAVSACVDAVGGEETLREGDVLLSSDGYANGSHANDVCIVVPVFSDGELIGYSAVKAHLMDVGAKEPFCNDTVDVFQEGTIFPGVRLYRAGELQDDIYRTALANTRVPKLYAGDLNAEISSARAGEAALVRLHEKVGADAFARAVEAMFDHGETVVRAFVEQIPDGRYAGSGQLDSNGVDPAPVPFGVDVEVVGTDILIDFSDSPPEQRGPINCPLPATVSIARLAVVSVAGGSEFLNEGCLRPIVVCTRPGTMFHPRPPAPVYLYAWPPVQALEIIHRALGEAIPKWVPAPSGADIAVIIWWGRDADGEMWTTGTDHFVGQGATFDGDASAPLMHISCSGIRNTPAEVVEQRFPLMVRRFALAPDSGGPGRWRGGLGIDVAYEVLSDSFATMTLEHTLAPAEGLQGGGSAGRANGVDVRLPDGTVVPVAKTTGCELPAGTVVEVHMGGGGGFGPPSERDPGLVAADIQAGYVSEAAARVAYPHAFRSHEEGSAE